MYEMLVALDVKDDDLYAKYREAMAPILKKFGGGFSYDFTIDRVLRKETENAINRVFTIYFKDEYSKDSFFSDPDYKIAKEKFFEKSVRATTIIAGYSRNG